MAGKKNSGNLLSVALIGIGAAIFYFGRTASTIDALDYDFRGFKFTKLGFPITQAQGSLSINNPTTQKLNFNSLFLNLVYKGAIIGTVKLDEKKTISARSESHITFPIDIRVAQVVNQAFDMAVLRRLDDIHLQGTIYLNGVNYPVETSVSLT